MEQVYRRTPMPKCDFNKVALHLKFSTGFILILPGYNRSVSNIEIITWKTT